MSHVVYITKYKKELIEKGVTCPELHIELVRNAYVAALIRTITAKDIRKEDRNDFLVKMLGYWNEIYPVNGNLVLLQINNFYRSLNASLRSIKSDLFVKLITNKENGTEEQPGYNDLQSYEDLLNILYDEACSKYVSFGKLKGDE